MLLHHNARVNSHQRWKQMRFRVCFLLWCESTSTMKVTERQVSWNTCTVWSMSSGILHCEAVCSCWRGMDARGNLSLECYSFKHTGCDMAVWMDTATLGIALPGHWQASLYIDDRLESAKSKNITRLNRHIALWHNKSRVTQLPSTW